MAVAEASGRFVVMAAAERPGGGARTRGAALASRSSRLAWALSGVLHGGLLAAFAFAPLSGFEPQVAPRLELALGRAPGAVALRVAEPSEVSERVPRSRERVVARVAASGSWRCERRLEPAPFSARQLETWIVERFPPLAREAAAPEPRLRPIERPAAPEPVEEKRREQPERARPEVAGEGGAGYVAAPVARAQNRPPRYPRRARRLGLEGRVVLEVRVDARGEVVRCRVKRSSGHGILDEAAARAVCTWRYEPARDAQGRFVAATIEVPIRFVLR